MAVRLRERPNLRSLLVSLLVIVMIGAAATLFGWDLVGWLEDVWDTITTISIGYLIAGIVLITIQTTAAAFAWYSILRYAYPGEVRWIQVLGLLRDGGRAELRAPRATSARS